MRKEMVENMHKIYHLFKINLKETERGEVHMTSLFEERPEQQADILPDLGQRCITHLNGVGRC